MSPLALRVLAGATLGLLLSLVFLAIGGVNVAVAFLSGGSLKIDHEDRMALALYPVSFIVAGVVIGALAPIRRHLLGALFLGVLAAGSFFGVLMLAISGWYSAWKPVDVAMLAMLTIITGPVLGYNIWKYRE